MAYSLTDSFCRDRFNVVETRRFTHELTGPLPGREYHVRVSARDPFGRPWRDRSAVYRPGSVTRAAAAISLRKMMLVPLRVP
jgi:hypothetical protein